MKEVTLNVQIREEKGKEGAKRLRKKGLTPGILYGKSDSPSMLVMDAKDLLTKLHISGRNAIFNLAVDDGKEEFKAFIYDIQHEPMTDQILHIDFKHILLTEKMRVNVPVHLEGVPIGVKNEAGIIEHIMHTVEIECLPTSIPSSIDLNIEELDIGDSIHVRELEVEDFKILSDEDRTVVHVVAPKVVIEEEELEEEGEELEEGAEPELVGKSEEDEDQGE